MAGLELSNSNEQVVMNIFDHIETSELTKDYTIHFSTDRRRLYKTFSLSNVVD